MGRPLAGVRPVSSEEGEALYGVVMAVTAAAGGMIAVFDAVAGSPALTAAPTIVLLAALAQRSQRAAAWSGVALWVVVLPMGNGIGILAPVAMAVLCLAFAIGPDRLLDWVRDEWIGREPVTTRRDVGWIEEDRSG